MSDMWETSKIKNWVQDLVFYFGSQIIPRRRSEFSRPRLAVFCGQKTLLRLTKAKKSKGVCSFQAHAFVPEVGIGHSRLIFCFWFDKLTIAKYLTPLTSTRPGRFADSVGARFDSHSNTKILKPKCIHIWVKVFYVPEVGIEPTSLARHDFKSCAYTYSATRANEKYLSFKNNI